MANPDLQKIASFTINHDTLVPGIYISRRDGDIITYDLRFKAPNGGDYLDNASLHTTEHLGATYVRSSHFGDRVIYFGPMGCRTGFYLLLRDVPPRDAVKLVLETAEFIASFSDEVPGATAPECGNYLEHDLQRAKADAAAFLKAIQGWDENKLSYPN